MRRSIICLAGAVTFSVLLAACGRDAEVTHSSSSTRSVAPTSTTIRSSRTTSPEAGVTIATIETEGFVSSQHAIRVSETTVRAGDVVEISAECPMQTTPPYQALTLSVVPPLGGAQYLLGIPFVDGLASGSVQVPTSATAGSYTIYPQCEIERTVEPLRRFRPVLLTVE
ncbi:MAG: hypothetical protein ACRDV7_12985 [Acidimicrobiia bacterium]